MRGARGSGTLAQAAEPLSVAPCPRLWLQEMRRALFMYAKLNPGLRYIQGMNELIAPLYYLFKNDPDPHAQAFAEADAFW